jgi:hypothetical protein
VAAGDKLHLGIGYDNGWSTRTVISYFKHVLGLYARYVPFLRSAYAHGLPGAQAIAVHGYAARFGFSLPQIVAWNRQTRLPLWITEGLLGPGSWPAASPDMHDLPLSAMAGAAVVDAWLG